ncbi:MAG: rhodanese-like domain-containing protein [Timaviella obliquedivisa GSE-PSE-MK23-08B]|nr:rhodanese-like domain-containing protein [Timaviella obliquedivisa GSE-PSE-MK23-08B]
MFAIRQAIAFNLLKKLIRLKFPSVQRMTTIEFAQTLMNDQQSQPLILDARSEAEFAVSHLAEAQLFDGTNLAIAPALKNVSKHTPIVVYCSVGYRSARVAQQIMSAGFQDVSNLEGGLFQWINEGRIAKQLCPGALVQDGQLTQLVHPYNAVWGALLNKQHRLIFD